MKTENAPTPGYEVEDAKPRLIGIVAAIVAVSVVASLVLVAWLYHRNFRELAGQARQTPFAGGANYHTSIEADWAPLDRMQDQHLNHYAWLDRAHGVVQIPIDRAMERLVEESAKQPKP